MTPALALQGQATPTHRPPPQEGPPLVEQLLDAWEAKRGAKYAYRPRRDDAAVTECLSLAGGDWAEVVRRWRIALERERFPVCNSLSDLVKHWNAYAKAEAPAKPKGFGRAQDVDWDAHERNPPDAPF